ncbi:liprin-beta-2-like [Scleropages formosus]|uniref:liprin-beta-2-like n=1 Tax=Scleropages formosus TaxID=113540 RepID=UPI0010FABF08|nr:liprin-beta-2-like [Scleropages formosus]
MASPASHMLEVALEQMDGIIAGSQAVAGQDEVLRLVEELKTALEAKASPQHWDTVRKQLPSATTQILKEWLNEVTVRDETHQERLIRLESDRESLVLQVSVLTDQVEVQGEKIRDLESSLEEHHQKLHSTEEMLQQEMHGRASLETQKLDLMGEVSYLKLKLKGFEEEQNEMYSNQHKAEVLLQQIQLLKDKVDDLESQKSQYERKLKATKVEVASLKQLLAAKDAEIERLQVQLLSDRPREPVEPDKDVQRLKTEMEALLIENDQKERRIEELTFLLQQHRRVHKVASLARGKGPLSGEGTLTGSSEEDLSGASKMIVQDFKMPSNSSSPLRAFPQSEQQDVGSRMQLRMLSSSLTELKSGSLQKTRQMDSPKCQSLPGRLSQPHRHEGGQQQCPGKVTGKADLLSSAPGFYTSRHLPADLHSGLKRFWGRIRRTQSGRLPVEELETGEFHRGGLRSIPGPRLVGSTSTVVSAARHKNIPFSLWSPDQVYDWLEELGLDQLGTSARQWIRSGQMLLDATPHDLEKEMGLKHPLHRKKLQLALLSLSSVQTEKSSQLGHTWVTRWLDDIGLPQYKDQFGEARVDGRMLQYLTVNDLLLLKVTSQLHHVSIRCAIHVLHIHGFDPHYLRRRPGDENETSPGEVLRWSNHRVMEWLRSVDLAEFAPNLRGSGVHGGLIMLEPRFNADTLASLLNIPPLKTLLRRHLGTSFCALIGPLAQREKQDFLEGPGHTPLNSTAKVRPRKLGFSNFGHLRKKRVVECPEYICPMESTPSAVNGGPKGQYPLLDTVAGTLEQVSEFSASGLQVQAKDHRTFSVTCIRETTL